MNTGSPHSGTPPLKEVVEALLFASDEPLSLKTIIDIVGEAENGTAGWKVHQEIIRGYIHDLNEEYEQSGRPFRLVEIAGGFQFATQKRFGHWLGRMVREKSKRKLTVSALESLAVIAYKQPVTKPEIEAIRGVNADYVLRSLLERNMITIVGRAATPGRPLLYGTTKEFLKHFGLNDLSDLPKPREIEELLAEAEYEVEKRILREQEERELAGRASGAIVVNEDGALSGLDSEANEEREGDEDAP
ncbi:MAG: SMC-Scp complex subunit ScpB [Ignavibacteria bacterium]|nr:SMC-Scp complex subunit ScpB [Ignavibacteria bacterium]